MQFYLEINIRKYIVHIDNVLERGLNLRAFWKDFKRKNIFNISEKSYYKTTSTSAVVQSLKLCFFFTTYT